MTGSRAAGRPPWRPRSGRPARPSRQTIANPSTVSLNTQYLRDAGGTWSFTLNPVVNLRPSAAVSLQLGPSYVRGFTAAQFITSQDDAAATATYLARYVF